MTHGLHGVDRHIPLVISTGEPFARGQHLGRIGRDRIKHTITAYMEIFSRKCGLSRDAVFARADGFEQPISSYAPHLLDEMRGIADGAGCDLHEIIAINARTELMHGVKQPSECTSIGVSADVATDGHLRLAQNWDWHPALTGSLVLWLLRRDEGPDILTLTEAGIVGKIGTNAMGLTMCVNLLTSDTDNEGSAVPMHIILRRILEDAYSTEDAITLIGETERCTSCFHMLADRGGILLGVEATPIGQCVLSATEGILTHTNHCMSPELAAYDRRMREYPETLIRGARVRSLATAQMIDENYLRSILRDHATASRPICLHSQSQLPFEEQGASIASIIFDLTARTLDIADGPPCQYSYRRYELDDLLRQIGRN
jgi:isopenicillin-N N-acyltransferase like protein